MLSRLEPSRSDRESDLAARGFPAYTTTAGWLGYSEATIRERCAEAFAQGFQHFKLKVGADREDDRRRAQIMRDAIGADRSLMIDANQRWDVQEAIDRVTELAEFRPLWIEEPTSPDDVLGHAAIARGVRPLGIGVATGECCQNRILFKQYLQAKAIDYCQVDACRLGGINEVVSVLLLAARFGVPVCPHAGGVGLCEYIQHVSIFDYIAVSGSAEGRIAEFVDHLHEHFVDPCIIENGAYRLPEAPGTSIEIKSESLEDYVYPGGPIWKYLFWKNAS
jgi:L-fuconate dehydratase